MDAFINRIYAISPELRESTAFNVENKLDQLIERYPYISGLHNLKLEHYKESHNYLQDDLMHKALLYCHDRNKIYKLVKGTLKFDTLDADFEPLAQPIVTFEDIQILSSPSVNILQTQHDAVEEIPEVIESITEPNLVTDKVDEALASEDPIAVYLPELEDNDLKITEEKITVVENLKQEEVAEIPLPEPIRWDAIIVDYLPHLNIAGKLNADLKYVDNPVIPKKIPEVTFDISETTIEVPQPIRGEMEQINEIIVPVTEISEPIIEVTEQVILTPVPVAEVISPVGEVPEPEIQEHELVMEPVDMTSEKEASLNLSEQIASKTEDHEPKTAERFDDVELIIKNDPFNEYDQIQVASDNKILEKEEIALDEFIEEDFEKENHAKNEKKKKKKNKKGKSKDKSKNEAGHIIYISEASDTAKDETATNFEKEQEANLDEDQSGIAQVSDILETNINLTTESEMIKETETSNEESIIVNQIEVPELEISTPINPEPDFLAEVQNIEEEGASIEAEFNAKIAQEVVHLKNLPEDDESNMERVKSSVQKSIEISESSQETSSFTNWLLKLHGPHVDPKTEKIDSKVQESSENTPVKVKTKDQVKSIAEQSLLWDDEIITETLAEILASQGHNSRAIEMYRKLMVKFPEKNTTFAAKIKNLEL
jgi:hypothetical protein